jgi:hypothetical protein
MDPQTPVKILSAGEVKIDVRAIVSSTVEIAKKSM